MAGHGNVIGKAGDLLDAVGIGVGGMGSVRYKRINEQKHVGSNSDDPLVQDHHVIGCEPWLQPVHDWAIRLR